MNSTWQNRGVEALTPESKEVLEFARRVIDIFGPKLILGTSDEIT